MSSTKEVLAQQIQRVKTLQMQTAAKERNATKKAEQQRVDVNKLIEHSMSGCVKHFYGKISGDYSQFLSRQRHNKHAPSYAREYRVNDLWDCRSINPWDLENSDYTEIDYCIAISRRLNKLFKENKVNFECEWEIHTPSAGSCLMRQKNKHFLFRFYIRTITGPSARPLLLQHSGHPNQVLPPSPYESMASEGVGVTHFLPTALQVYSPPIPQPDSAREKFFWTVNTSGYVAKVFQPLESPRLIAFKTR